MTDAHCHVRRGESRHILCEPCDVASAAPGDAVFFGFHPWYLDGFDADALRSRLAANPRAGVGEIGMDRLRDKVMPTAMREAFEAQLAIAASRREVLGRGLPRCREVRRTHPRVPLPRLFALRGACPRHCADQRIHLHRPGAAERPRGQLPRTREDHSPGDAACRKRRDCGEHRRSPAGRRSRREARGTPRRPA